jgi:hypothetical protein
LTFADWPSRLRIIDRCGVLCHREVFMKISVIAWLGLVAMTLGCVGCQPRPVSEDFYGTKRVAHYADEEGRTGMRGRVTVRATGEPLPGAYVNIYPETFSNLLGPSQFISSPTDENGEYFLPLPPGTFFVVARKRMSGEPTGPLAPGDFFSEHQRIVTRVIQGRVALVDLPMVAMISPMFFKREVVERETDTGMRGVLVDIEGRPVPGGFAMAYIDRDMQRLPDYASTLSDEQGRFTLYLPRGGTFYLAARIHAWDMPVPGEPYGKLGGESLEAVTVAGGSFVEGLQIVMAPFAGEYRPGKSRKPF